MKTKTKLPSKREFAAFEMVRQSGAFNMLTQASGAAMDAGLTLDRYMAVLRNYELCMKKWPEVRK